MKKIFALMLALIFALSAFAFADEIVVDEAANKEYEMHEAVEDEKEEEEAKAWVNILLLGGDSRSTDAYERTDTIIILSINRDEALVKMTSIMRDTLVKIPGWRKENKINAANVFGGPELVVQTVNLNFGTDIEDYVIVNMDQMAQIINLFGGVDIEITAAEMKEINEGSNGGVILNSVGMVHLNGEQAVTYSRIRYIDNDYVRVMRQQSVLKAMAAAAQDMEVDALMDISAEVREMVNTSLDDDEMESLATAFMVMEVEEVQQLRLPADGTFKSGMVGEIWCIQPDLAKSKQILKEFIYGE